MGILGLTVFIVVESCFFIFLFKHFFGSFSSWKELLNHTKFWFLADWHGFCANEGSEGFEPPMKFFKCLIYGFSFGILLYSFIVDFLKI